MNATKISCTVCGREFDNHRQLNGHMNAHGPARHLRILFEAGFDRSAKAADGEGCRVGCSQCNALVINGIACHETGCLNQVRR